MAATFDPADPSYLDEKSVRDEFTRVATVCRDCRRCAEMCGAFPTLFDLLNARQDQDPGRLAPAQQDAVAEECFQCGRCVTSCPYSPGVHELEVDVPRLVLRLAAMRRATGQVSVRARMSTWLLTRRGWIARMVRGAPGSLGRRLIGRISDLSPRRLLGPHERPSFSEGIRRRPSRPDVTEAATTTESTTVTVFPTCLVEHEAPKIGEALVRVYERNGIGCSVSAAGCCGAPWLHAGDIDEFARVARRNVRILAEEIRRGGDLVVPQPSCLRVLIDHVPAHVGGPDAELVANHAVDAVDYLLRLRDADGAGLDTDFRGDVPGRIACHVGPMSPAGGSRVVDLLELTGARVRPVDRAAGTGVTWGWRQAHVETSLALARRLADDLGEPAADVVVGDDHRANTAILEQTGALPSHPLEVIARAYDSDHGD